eukprot:m.343160 g.343160  ORF g.343160 m.343160 type:complete len:291 (-) comp22431_c0_seq1:64-936(-)
MSVCLRFLVALTTSLGYVLSQDMCTLPSGNNVAQMLQDLPPCNAEPKVGTACSSSGKLLHPTQTSVGFLTVDCKTQKLNSKSPSKLASYLMSHPVPSVIGPGNVMYITDHHHMTKALLQSNYSTTPLVVCPQLDMRHASDFWGEMKKMGLVWMHDRMGNNISNYSDIPPVVTECQDDPYRSLSEWVRDDYGYVKCSSDTAKLPPCEKQKNCCTNPPFLEFYWADALRKQYPISSIYSSTPKKQVAPLLQVYPPSLKLVKEPTYKSLPNYYSGTEEPNPPVKVDPSSGCES